MSSGTPTQQNGMWGWVLQVANLTAVGGLMVFLFWYADRSFAIQKQNLDNNNEFHRDIYQHIGQQQTQTDIMHNDIKETHKEVTEIKWVIKMHSGGLASMFFDQKEKK